MSGLGLRLIPLGLHTNLPFVPFASLRQMISAKLEQLGEYNVLIGAGVQTCVYVCVDGVKLGSYSISYCARLATARWNVTLHRGTQTTDSNNATVIDYTCHSYVTCAI